MITNFSGDYRWLSNFYPCNVTLDDVTYPSVEHAYQAAKTIDYNNRVMIRNASTAAIAKKLSKNLVLRPNWVDMKYNVMYNLCVQKFQQEPLKTKLIETGNQMLVEGNTWGDTYWGICNGVGENKLGQILMNIRFGLNNDFI